MLVTLVRLTQVMNVLGLAGIHRPGTQRRDVRFESCSSERQRYSPTFALVLLSHSCILYVRLNMCDFAAHELMLWFIAFLRGSSQRVIDLL